MLDIKGKWALITGASRGIGRLAALFMAKQGCNLILHSRKASHAQTLAEEVSQLGVKVHIVSAELSDAAEVQQMLAEIDSLNLTIDIVLNNAGLQVTYRNNYFETPSEDFDTSFRINTVAPMMICYHFLPKMIENGFGRIVNTSSGIRLEPQQAPYSASKAALDKVTIDLGSTVEGTDVTINLVDPGWCRTDLGGNKAPNAPESAVPGVVLPVFVSDKHSGRWFSAQDYAGLTLEEAIQKYQQLSAK